LKSARLKSDTENTVFDSELVLDFIGNKKRVLAKHAEGAKERRKEEKRKRRKEEIQHPPDFRFLPLCGLCVLCEKIFCLSQRRKVRKAKKQGSGFSIITQFLYLFIFADFACFARNIVF